MHRKSLEKLHSLSQIKIVNDPVHGFLSVPQNLVFQVIDHPYFQRLRRIKQLGLTHLVYPGALHTRFHHALGAFHLMSEALTILKQKGASISEEDEKAAQIAILLHDIGHGPFSHALENTIVKDVTHEELSDFFMHRMNEYFEGGLTNAIAVFNDQYNRQQQFLHELVASQLDVDRLDYLARDSFYTGVSEGIVGVERIIKMLNVHENRLAIENKGIYSIEKFLISRRIMYWQVYMHKTVLGAEQLLLKILERAQELARRGAELFATPAFQFFLKNRVKKSDFRENSNVLDTFAHLDDHDIMASIKTWVSNKDQTLSTLCDHMMKRKLFKTIIADEPFDADQIDRLRQKAAEHYQIPEEESQYFVFSNSIANAAYAPRKGININILMKNGSIQDIAEASDHYNISALSKPVEKYFLCYPAVLQNEAS